MTMTMLDQRKVEAAMLAEVYKTVQEAAGPDAALAVVERTLERMAFQAGQAFAAQAEGAPNLKHFATILERWKGTGALDIENVALTDTELSFQVVRCGYAAAYRDMGLPEALVRTLSCIRDEPFAKGYSDRLSLVRPETIAAGRKACGFQFIWE